MADDMSKFMLQHDWIIEGNYSTCLYEKRMREADCIIYFNFNRVNCLYRAFRRYLRYKGRRVLAWRKIVMKNSISNL